MNILHLSNTPLSNAPANLVSIQRAAGHNATLLLHRKTNVNKVYVGGNQWNEFSFDQLEEMFDTADVIHFHNYHLELEIFRVYPQLIGTAACHPQLIQYHSPRNSIEDFEASIANTSIKHAVIAQYHVRQYPECEFVVPNVIPIYSQTYQGVKAKWNDFIVPTVSYAPSNISLKGWDYKGFDITKPVLHAMERQGRITPDIINNVPYEDCMIRKRWAHIGIDEVVTGSYHLSTLEYLSMGCATIVHMDSLTRQAMQRIVGEEGMQALPTVDVKGDALSGTLSALVAEGKEALEARGTASRQWMEKFWNPADHVKRFDDIYRSL